MLSTEEFIYLNIHDSKGICDSQSWYMALELRNIRSDSPHKSHVDL